jgi:hypothetical protein
MDTSFFGKDGFIWWKGVIEDRKDPIFLGRLRVRIFGWHTEDRMELPTEDLPWAVPSLPLDHGRNSVGPREGDWCWGFFLDGKEAQKPIVVGYIPGIDEEPSKTESGYGDPTPDDQLTPDNVPRPPDMAPLEEGEASADQEQQSNTKSGKYGDGQRLPGANTAFGQLTTDYSADRYKFDVNKDGKYDQSDADKMLDLDNDGVPNNEKEFFSGQISTSVASAPMSRYPLENRLMEPSTSRLSRNEKIEETIVALKRGEMDSGEGGGYEAAGVGGDSGSEPLAFSEPDTPYNAKYPYNHVYESESGHVIEVDDSPGAQRLHWYHRSGTFTEIHPNGLEVNKIKKSQYNFIYEDYYNATKKSMNLDAGDAYRLKAGTVINLNSGSDHNRQVGANLNGNIGESINTRVGKSVFTGIGEETRTIAGEGVYVCSKGSVVHIKATGEINLQSASMIVLQAPQIHLAGQVFAPNPPYSSPIATPNDADNEDKIEEKPVEASPKYGYLLPKGTVGDVYKPISDSDKKLVTLSAAGPNHELREALPTGQLEAVVIKFQHPDGQITKWEIVRPVHIPGDLIDSPARQEMFEDGVRHMCRWSKAGAKYPKQMFWVVPGGAENLILDSAERHQCLTGPFNDRINFDLRTRKSVK